MSTSASNLMSILSFLFIVQILNVLLYPKTKKLKSEAFDILFFTLFWFVLFVICKSKDISKYNSCDLSLAKPYNPKTFEYILSRSTVMTDSQYQTSNFSLLICIDIAKYENSKKLDPEEWLNGFKEVLEVKDNRKLNKRLF